MKFLQINATRSSYSPDGVKHTMTVKELREFIEDFNDDLPVILSHDNGYTYGPVSEEAGIEESEY